MKRLRVADIEKLLGLAAAERLVEGVKSLRHRKTYTVEVIETRTSRVPMEATSEVEARTLAEQGVLSETVTIDVVDVGVRSRIMRVPKPKTVLDRDWPHGLVDERIHTTDRRGPKVYEPPPAQPGDFDKTTVEGGALRVQRRKPPKRD